MKKRGFRAGLATLLCAFLIGLSAASPVKAASILYEIKTVKTLTRGVTLETRQTITSDGPLDIHVLRAPLNDPYINVAPADSTKDYGLKDTVAALLSERGAIAGVNGSFFGVAGTYSAAFGPVIKDGQLISVSGDINQGKEDFGALFIDNQSAPFFSFLKTSMHFYHDGQENIEVNSYNTITDMEYPVIVTTAALQNTSSLDGRFSGLVKILVRNQEIFYISAPGETVSIPADGFALIIKKETAERVGASFQTGQRAELRVEPSVDFSQIKMAIGGGGLILRGGEFVKTGTVIEGRQPRTAVGISQDKTQLVLVQVDGRSNSIGATPEEMGMIMQRCGAYEAMHLDGGGSSAIVIQNPDSGYQVVNTLSDGYQRKVINALGVFNNAPVGPAETLVIDTPEGNVFAKIPCNVSVYGLDAYYHRIDIGGGLMTLETDDPDGQWKDSTYTPGRAGTIHITARYNGLVADAALNALAIQEVASSLEIIRAMPGGAVDIRFTATGGDGEQADVTALGQYAVVPPELGTIADGKFTAMAEGAGYAACTVNGVSAYVPVYVGGRVEPAFSLGSQIETQFIGYPDSVQGAVSYDGENQAWATSYQFGMSDATQAAYFTFAEPPAVPGEPIALRLSVLGDSAGGMLRGKILDADNREHTIEFAPEMDWDGWRQVTAMIPDGVHYPIRLSRVYAAVLSLTAARGGGIHIKEAAAVYPFTQEAALPQAQRYVDPWLADLNGAPEGGAFDLEWTGAALKENQPYQFTIRESAAVLHLSGAKGGLAASNPEQWTWLAQDLSGVNASVLIVTLDRNPFDFSNPKEFELFHQALVQQKEKGKKVLVVSARGANNGGVSKDGIRYISLNADNSLLKIRVSGDAAQYQINLGA